MKLFAGLSLVVSTIITWVLMFAYRPDPVLNNMTLFSFQNIHPPLSHAQLDLLEKMREANIHLEAMVFTGTHQQVLLNIPELGDLLWLRNELPSQRNRLAASRIRPLMKAVWGVAQLQLARDGVNVNQIERLGLWYPNGMEALEISNTLSDWGL